MGLETSTGAVPVVDPGGRVLTPCTQAKADENLALGLADLVDGVLHLRYRPLAYRRIFRDVLRRDGLVCAWCGQPGSTIDHLVPVSLGGETRWDNCVVSCRPCNHSRNNRLPSTFLAATGAPVIHPLIEAVLAHEAERLARAAQSLIDRPVSRCKSREEAQVWAQAHAGQRAGPALPDASARLASRVRPERRPVEGFYLP